MNLQIVLGAADLNMKSCHNCGVSSNCDLTIFHDVSMGFTMHNVAKAYGN